MSRFFNAQPIDLVDDFIFQPNLQLATQVLMKKDADIQQQIELLDLMGNLPIESWKDADQDNVRAIKSDYENKVNDLAKEMQGNLANTGKNRRMLNQLRREIENDYEFGNIRQIQDNAAEYKRFNELLNALPNPADREVYQKVLDDYLLNNEKGALSSIFKAPEMHSMRDLWEEFTSSGAFKGLKADQIASSITNTNGRYMVTEAGQQVELSESKIGQAFDTWLKSANLDSYARDRQKYHGQQWLDGEGNIRKDTGSYLGSIIESGIPSLAYKQTSNSRGMTVDQYGVMRESAAIQKQAEIDRENRAIANAERQKQAENNAILALLGNDVDAKGAYRVQSEVRDFEKGYVDEFLDRIYRNMNGIDLVKMTPEQLKASMAWRNNNKIKSIDDIINFYGKDPKYSKVVNDAKIVKNKTKELLKGSYEDLARAGFDLDIIKTFETKHKADFNNYANTTKFNILDSDKGLVTEHGMGITPQSLVGKTVVGPQGEKVKVQEAEILKDSNVPIFLNKDLNNNFGVAVMRIYYGSDANGDGQQYIDKKVSYSLKDLGGNY